MDRLGSLPCLVLILGPEKTDQLLSGILCWKERENQAGDMLSFYVTALNIKGTAEKYSPTMRPGGEPDAFGRQDSGILGPVVTQACDLQSIITDRHQ